MHKESSLVFLQYLTTVFDNVGEAIFLISVEPDERYKLLIANETFYQGTGYSRDSAGKFVDEIAEPSSYASLKEYYRRAASTRRPLEFTEWFGVPLGNQAYFVKVIPITNAVGECVQLAIIARNVTELEGFREANKKLRTELKNMLRN